MTHQDISSNKVETVFSTSLQGKVVDIHIKIKKSESKVICNKRTLFTYNLGAHQKNGNITVSAVLEDAVSL